MEKVAILDVLAVFEDIVKNTEAAFIVLNHETIPNSQERTAFQARVGAKAIDLCDTLRKEKWSNGEMLELSRLLFQVQVLRLLAAAKDSSV